MAGNNYEPFHSRNFAIVRKKMRKIPQNKANRICLVQNLEVLRKLKLLSRLVWVESFMKLF